MDGEQIVHDVAEKVRALVTEAEERAAQIVRDAEAEAQSIRERAQAESSERLEAARSALEELQSKLGIGAEVPGGPVPVPEPSPPSIPEPTPEPPAPAPSPEPAPEPEPPLIPEPTPPPDEGTPPEIAATNGAKSADAAGARLVAMNLALDGSSRDDIVARLNADYELADAGALADEILAVAGK
jgi:hypothetical protein